MIKKYAYILLALIENAGKIGWTDTDGTTTTLGIDAANTLLLQEVKSYAPSPQTIPSLLDELKL